jgi:hypothetical protein
MDDRSGQPEGSTALHAQLLWVLHTVQAVVHTLQLAGAWEVVSGHLLEVSESPWQGGVSTPACSW